MAFLTIERRGGNRGQGWEVAGTKIAQEDGIARRRVTPSWTRVPAVVFPQCSLGATLGLRARRWGYLLMW
jgi:hypothetical protein